LTDAKKSQWALGNGAATIVGLVLQMTGAPNEWREQGGKFTYVHETDEAKQALDAVTQLVRKGVFHPDSFAGNADVRTWFGSGRVAFLRDGYAAWDLLANTYQIDIGGLVVPKHAGGGDAQYNAGQTTFALTALKKTASRERIEELLRICNWLAAPVGTEEHLFRTYGTDGEHFSASGGTPTATAKGKQELKLPLKYIVDSPPVLGPASADRVRRQHEYQQRVVPHLRKDASVGLYSDTKSSKAGTLRKLVQNAQTEIVQGRKPLSHWDEVVKQWRSQGGDAMRREFEADFARVNGG
jgi:putative aldouronate transport system substrate-binding protein